MTNSRRLRLLYLLPAEGFGGAERQGAYHIAELPRHGVDVTAFAGPGEPIAKVLEEAGAEYEHFRYFPARTSAPGAERALLAARSVAAISRSITEIEKRVRGATIDLIFANRTSAWLVGAALSKKLDIPYVVRVGSRPARPIFGLGLGLLRHAARPAAAFYNCRAVERAVAPYLCCPAHFLPNAVDTRQFFPASPIGRAVARARLRLPQDRLLVGLAARPAPEKGLDFLADVVVRVRARIPQAQFVIAGEFGWRAEYERRLHAAGLAPSIRFLGHVDTMPGFFQSMDVVVLTSRERSIEASPNALLEAMATGRPVVATAVGGVPELVRPGREGYLTRDGDGAEFAARVIELLQSPEHREELGRAGRARAEAYHRVPVVVAELARELRAIASASTPVVLSPHGATSCESTIHSAPRSIYSYERPPSKPNWSSPGAAI